MMCQIYWHGHSTLFLCLPFLFFVNVLTYQDSASVTAQHVTCTPFMQQTQQLTFRLYSQKQCVVKKALETDTKLISEDFLSAGV